MNAAGASEWEESGDERTTITTVRELLQRDSKNITDRTNLVTATERYAAKSSHLYYINGVGNGGAAKQDGQNGVVIIHPYTFDGQRLPDIVFFLTGVEEVRSERMAL